MSDSTLLDIVVGHVGSARGRKAAPLSMDMVRELNESDLDLLNSSIPLGSTSSPLMKLRFAHHQLARLLASGTKAVEASAITGYSQSRISILQNDPAFKELLAYYKEQKEEVYLDAHNRLASLGISAVETLQERLEDEPDKLTNRELMELVEITMDRTVAPPKNPNSKGQTGPIVAPTINIQFVSPPQLAVAAAAPQLELEGIEINDTV